LSVGVLWYRQEVLMIPFFCGSRVVQVDHPCLVLWSKMDLSALTKTSTVCRIQFYWFLLVFNMLLLFLLLFYIIFVSNIIRNSADQNTTRLSALTNCVSCKHLSVFSHIARLAEDHPTNGAFWLVVNFAIDSVARSPQWQRPPASRPWRTWLSHINKDLVLWIFFSRNFQTLESFCWLIDHLMQRCPVLIYLSFFFCTVLRFCIQ